MWALPGTSLGTGITRVTTFLFTLVLTEQLAVAFSFAWHMESTTETTTAVT